MKRILLILMLLTGTLFGYSQTVTVHVDGESLENLLSQEQVQSLQTLNITGTLTGNDYAFLRSNKFPKIRELNLKNADIDTIPAKAFYATEYYYDSKIILPKTCVYVGDSAFCECNLDVELTGNFPQRGAQVFSPYRNRIWLSADNEYCVEYTDDNHGIYILSIDKKIFYHASCTSSRDIIPEGVEVIAERAFENSASDKIYFPHTLKKIEDYAFHNSSMAFNSWNYIFLSDEVPALGKEVFSFYSGAPALTIPQEWEEIYRTKDEQWNVFKEVIFAYNPPPTASISYQKFEHCTILITASTIHCTAPDALKLEVYTMDAVKVGEARFVGGEASVRIDKNPALYLYIVTYPDGRRESGKVALQQQ